VISEETSFNGAGGQADDDVDQTERRTRAIRPEVVKAMIEKGLARSWVEQQIATYNAAMQSGGKKRSNKQLVPRLRLMQAILRDWPNE
jgi:hypothetical protein